MRIPLPSSLRSELDALARLRYARWARRVYDARAAELRRRLEARAVRTDADPSLEAVLLGAAERPLNEAA